LLIRAGYNIAFHCTAETPLLLMLHIRPERHADLREPEKLVLDPETPHRMYTDDFGNICTRLVARVGRLSLSNRFLIADSGLPDRMPEGAIQHPVDELPNDVILYLLGSRYCDTQRLMEAAWAQFGNTAPGWPRVQAILQYAHDRIEFGYKHARSDRTAFDAHEEGLGVCRDYAHLGIALCRCMNIPARYCTGYLGDIGVPYDPNPMDFSAWFEVYLGGAWHTVDARHNHPRIGRIPMAVGRDATDAAISMAFGIAELVEFKVVTEEVAG
jgi:transglutaminase-like putative cysteine protease